ncbi:hypothetical protein PAXRUDRAFT_781074 [Paxillus rubicundulus Ve08.2h10]|uniref:Uncharacterized protein n=1 Tax=Paxillus rubicundulus Ve08.2h10 TaxID=930991 RepID=A0A0D0DCD1_9AGAM|nr:hypothetical protein PAXRUDRAFT_781074 [Paxillus rubicundulus Ve08.2h10]
MLKVAGKATPSSFTFANTRFEILAVHMQKHPTLHEDFIRHTMPTTESSCESSSSYSCGFPRDARCVVVSYHLGVRAYLVTHRIVGLRKARFRPSRCHASLSKFFEAAQYHLICSSRVYSDPQRPPLSCHACNYTDMP